MNGSQQVEVHYGNTGFPYAGSEGFMDFFEGLTHAPVHYSHVGSLHEQENAYWLMNINSYKFGVPGQGSSYFDPYEVNDHLSRMDINRSAWDYPSALNVEEPPEIDTYSGETRVLNMHAIPEECSPDHQIDANSQVIWQDNVDPDNMTYEELLDLGEAVGTENRGLSQELICMLPTSKYKSGGFFSRKKSGERCVICQMRYKRGDQQIHLPCKHVYHTECCTKWLGINKTCPICNTEVFGEESKC
ncbi:E3 ubiquitin ligase BIG BROTHER like [Actinidia chinensis var. chinensis]|uniref:E3 ubiquitin ligase BIG BROTHER like n=1 Tax=Actinidia chinensis var. chinensis TaxID=1590841 RepID=A0A2R6RD36_ACTCC|nr:E3 ubiquitin ligase BIG BROTHER like [Actinidia chinensis var. chinensis]